MNAFYLKQRISARVLAVFALFSLIASMLPMQAFAAGVYTVNGSGSVAGAVVSLTGDSHANPQTGGNGTQAMAVDWDDDMDGDPDSGTGFVEEVDFTPTFFGGTDNNADGFDDADWDAAHTYTTSGTYNITVIVYHGNTNGNDGSDQSTFTYEADVVVDPVNTKPVITLTGAGTINLTVGDTYSEAGASATDVEDGPIASTSIAIDSSAVNTSVAGIYSVTYNVDDSESLAADEVTRTVVVADAVPQMCTVTIVSDDTAFVVEKSANAIEITPNPAWTASIAGASWIWGDATVVDGTVNETQTFRNQFGFVGDVSSATLQVASDNTHSATVNASSPFVSVDDSTFDNASSYDVTSSINESGNNQLNVAVTNLAAGTENPAGALYKLTIEGEVTTDDDCIVGYVDPATLGTLNVTKTVVGTTTVDESAFSFKVDGGATTTFDGTDGTNTLTLTAGTYDVVETAAPGYTTSYNSCDNVVVTAGQTSTCTITNTLITSTPQICTVNSFSSPSTTVNGSSTFSVGNEPGAWVDNIVGSLAEWIWSAIDGSTISGDTDETDTFVKTFVWDGPVTSATLKLAADNMYSVTLNGTNVGSSTDGDNYSNVDTIIDISDNIVQGTNTLEISVTNDANGATTLDGNPAGLIYDLTVNGNTVDDCTPDGGGGGGGNDDLTCNLTANDTSIRRGRDVTLTYTSNDATSATLDNGIGAVSLNGSTLVENLRSDTTYTMTVSDGDDTATCSVFINTTSGGGGGGGSRNNNNNNNNNNDNNNDNGNGQVLGASDDQGSGSVLGEQVSAYPLGAPNAGAGGTSPLNLVVNTLPIVAFLRRK